MYQLKALCYVSLFIKLKFLKCSVNNNYELEKHLQIVFHSVLVTTALARIEPVYFGLQRQLYSKARIFFRIAVPIIESLQPSLLYYS